MSISSRQGDPKIFIGQRPLATKEDIPVKISSLTNDSGFLTEHQDLTNYAKISDLNNKVDKVDGKVLSSNDFTTEEKICVIQDRIKSFLSRTILDEREFEHSQMPESMAFALMSPSEFEQMREKKSAIETLSKVYAENSEIIENASNLGRFKFITIMMNDNKVLNGEKLSESEQMLNDWDLCNLDEIQGEKEAN